LTDMPSLILIVVRDGCLRIARRASRILQTYASSTLLETVSRRQGFACRATRPGGQT
jgi:hypothetical protein